jgi:Mn-containing catalase
LKIKTGTGVEQMFLHKKELQFEAKPERPDPVFANKVQEVLGGQYGEISVMMQYLLQGWNCRADEKYRDMLLDIGTEEIGHVEMLATLIARLLDMAPVKMQEEAVAKDPAIAAVMGGMNPQHAIVGGLGALPVNSAGVPWSGSYIVSSGNLIADFRAYLNAESQGRLQVVRLYEMTDDPGVKKTLSFLIARDTMHQNQWLAALRKLEEQEGVVVPSTFPPEQEPEEFTHLFINHSEGKESAKGRWASGESIDGKGQFKFVEPFASHDRVGQQPAPPYLHGTLPIVK